MTFLLTHLSDLNWGAWLVLAVFFFACAAWFVSAWEKSIDVEGGT